MQRSRCQYVYSIQDAVVCPVMLVPLTLGHLSSGRSRPCSAEAVEARGGADTIPAWQPPSDFLDCSVIDRVALLNKGGMSALVGNPRGGRGNARRIWSPLVGGHEACRLVFWCVGGRRAASREQAVRRRRSGPASRTCAAGNALVSRPRKPAPH